MKEWPLLRDALLFVCGLGGVLHETVFTQAERPTLLILFAAMMGLPAFLRPNEITGGGGKAKKKLEEAKSDDKDSDQDSEDDSDGGE